jgi:hypothetical protein
VFSARYERDENTNLRRDEIRNLFGIIVGVTLTIVIG